MLNLTFNSSNCEEKVWWYCHRCEHEWKGVRPSRRKREYRCPKCEGHVTPGLPDKRWTVIRGEVFKREGYRCLKCRVHWTKETPLVAHHIRPIAEGGESYPENLITLCLRCHDKVHSTERWIRPLLIVPIIGWILSPFLIQRRRQALKNLIM